MGGASPARSPHRRCPRSALPAAAGRPGNSTHFTPPSGARRFSSVPCAFCRVSRLADFWKPMRSSSPLWAAALPARPTGQQARQGETTGQEACIHGGWFAGKVVRLKRRDDKKPRQPGGHHRGTAGDGRRRLPGGQPGWVWNVGASSPTPPQRPGGPATRVDHKTAARASRRLRVGGKYAVGDLAPPSVQHRAQRVVQRQHSGQHCRRWPGQLARLSRSASCGSRSRKVLSKPL